MASGWVFEWLDTGEGPRVPVEVLSTESVADLLVGRAPADLEAEIKMVTDLTAKFCGSFVEHFQNGDPRQAWPGIQWRD